MTQPTAKISGLPDPNDIGECEDRSSILCERDNAFPRLNPLDMLNIATAFNTYVRMCTPCYERRSDQYVAKLHGRDES